MITKFLLAGSVLALLPLPAVQPALAQAPAPAADAATLFGAREDVSQISLSPGGTKVAFIAPGPGPSSVLYISDVADGSVPKIALSSDGKPNRIRSCFWVSDTRLVCYLYMVFNTTGEVTDASRIVAVDADGRNLKMLSNGTRADDAYVSMGGGQVIDWLPEENGAILMGRNYVPEEKQATHMNDSREGFGVDRLDTASLSIKSVEAPRRDAIEYISDGRGKVRIMGTRQVAGASGYDRAAISYFYRTKDSNGWKNLGVLNEASREGFNPYAVDSDLDVAYGFEKKDGRLALYSLALDGSKRETLIFSRPDVDVDGLIRIGRRQRVVGVTFATDKRQAVYFDKNLQALAASLSKALPGLPLIQFVDSSVDESKLLLWAGSDIDPGRYYLFDKSNHQLHELMLSRLSLEGARLAEQKPVTYKAADGSVLPAYLTLPPGSSGRNLPAIVMPHGGPSARDEWGFDWLAQYFAARGYAVLQPEFRGSSGYGDNFFLKNGFQSWRTAIGDVDDAGRWLVAQGIADPGKLAIFGWSYGGYAALQANVLDPKLFRAAVAVAPVTDLATLVEEHRNWADYLTVQGLVGTGPNVREGSPAQNADRIAVPVMLFHGDLDINVGVRESKLMDEKLRDAGRQSQLVLYPGLDHQLEDGAVRADMLRRTDAFLRTALKIP
ncbi:MAG: peptidase prolyl oligopeptidase [Alphaproteobacteria bacterium]|nr:peptidase prolyl oligopeptidase [Alphaproteobacteria bacterium]